MYTSFLRQQTHHRRRHGLDAGGDGWAPARDGRGPSAVRAGRSPLALAVGDALGGHRAQPEHHDRHVALGVEGEVLGPHDRVGRLDVLGAQGLSQERARRARPAPGVLIVGGRVFLDLDGRGRGLVGLRPGP